MRASLLSLVLPALLIPAMGCQGPVSSRARSSPSIPGAMARSFKEGEKVWIELLLPHPDEREQWRASFDAGSPEGLQVIPGQDATTFKWIVASERVRLFGDSGYRLKAEKAGRTHRLTLDLTPNYVVVLNCVLHVVLAR